uniref:Uncharacterized protein n=1 Tax=Oryza sativa subsp. japonica TaxID=39947 RepID=Q5Z6H5_ORYSJ|nr:hypothetical protein [Oryza sativa Japonica Group]BAD54444.1 hypothetical protein [Oryza sativa Japonica Group]
MPLHHNFRPLRHIQPSPCYLLVVFVFVSTDKPAPEEESTAADGERRRMGKGFTGAAVPCLRLPFEYDLPVALLLKLIAKTKFMGLLFLSQL